ncbi:unnamed protein product [Heligmosomoides polygyrus]|uniref:CDC37_C domain-containing protein n=1 Tax=Heligmosomoides polygyrus TaxID=6339 RepID=A0A183FLH6_HELPZ|nr:unnamed protein product [Heligmosomoides polygyrus]
MWGAPHSNDEDSEVCAMNNRVWKWLPNKRTNCTVIREDFQAYEDLHRSNSPKQVQEFLKELEVWQCYPQCEGE